MTFRIELIVEGALPACLRSPDVELPRDGTLSAHDELVHVLTAQCRALARTGGVSFVVGGFGQERWPVDVETDLPVALEQLPGVLSALRLRRAPFELNFYEQGVERYLTGTPTDNVVRFECASMALDWSPSPAVEKVDLSEAERMFRALRTSYTTAVERVCPWLTPAPEFERWRNR